jgi:flagellum-specific peptidoglycan hydrolase FlgJ
MRKKFIKSSRPTYKKRIKKAQQGMRFVSYNPVSNPTIDYTDITNPINPFSEYNYNTTYDKPEALVVPVRDTEETDVVANNPTVEPVINKPVASKPVTDKPVTKTANSTWKSPYTNRKQWATELINAYKKAGITNDNAIRMLLAQDALESSWGKSAQGKYNFGNLTTGSSWKGDYVTGNDKNAKGEAIKQKFRSYNSMDEYAADKIQFLKRLYDFDENDDINKFVAKLTGSNKGKRRYAEATNYAKVLTGVYNGIPKGENGMIIKYQNPPHGIARRDATYVAPKMYAPRPYKTKEEEIIEQNRNSEMISIPAHSTIGMVDGKLQVIDTPARQITNVGAGYLSGTDPVGEFVVGNVAAGKPLMWLGKGVKYGAARVFKKGAKPKVDAYYPSKVYKRTVDDVNRDYLNFIEYIDNPETMQKLADIDKELGTQYVKAVTDFKEAAKQGKLRVKSPKPGTLDIQGYPIRNPQTLTHPDIMKNPSYDYIDIDILADFPPNSVGHEFKHAIENYQAALSGIKGSVDDALFANPRLQALMKDNIVSEDEFVASMVKRYPKNDIKEIRKVYKYLTDPGEFNAQLHPLIELEQRAGKSGLPNFKDADAVNQVIKQGRASGHGGSHLDILFNNLLKPDKREEFVKQFNKYGWSLAAPAIINNRE